MRLANLAGRSTLVTPEGLVDVAAASRGAFSPSLERCLLQLDQLKAWYEATAPAVDERVAPEGLYGDRRLGPVVSAPSQVFAVGLNYRDHAEEMGMTLPEAPLVFAKFASSLCGPSDEVPAPSATTDFEAELVVVIGARARDLDPESALGAVAGYCVGQDISERTLQRSGPTPQFSLAKSHRNFSPIGPWLTTADEVVDPNALAVRCAVNGVTYQDGRTSDMVFSVAEILSYLSSIVELRPGDLVFTGSPHGVGQSQDPPRFLAPGDRLVTEIEGLGRLENHVV